MSVLISNIDDFVNPSQACIIINPIGNDSDSKANTNKKTNGVGISTKIKVDMDISIPDDFANFSTSTNHMSDVIPISTIKQPDLLKTKKNKNNVEVATVSLSDCLACRFVNLTQSILFILSLLCIFIQLYIYIYIVVV